MSPPITRVPLLVPGILDDLDAWANALRGSGVDLRGGALHAPFLESSIPAELIDNDGGFGDAFSFGTVAPKPLKQIAAAPTALVLQSPIDLLDGRATLIRVVRALQKAGALAVRIEESKLGWEVARWLKLAATFMPTLHALLLALESKKGAPLTEDEVIAARDSAPCIAVKQLDARALERTRGYADLDPELAWEQWQVVSAGARHGRNTWASH